MNKLKLEPSKFYRTRDGNKVKIYAIEDENPLYPIIGSIRNNGIWVLSLWTEQGQYQFNSYEFHSDDIVSEWIQPKPTRKAYMLYTGEVYLFDDKQLIEMDDPINFSRFKRMPHLDEPEQE